MTGAVTGQPASVSPQLPTLWPDLKSGFYWRLFGGELCAEYPVP